MAVAAPSALLHAERRSERADRARSAGALIGFALDQQVTVPTAFLGPWKLKERLGTLDAAEIAHMDPDRLEGAFREKPAVHRFPGAMATRVRDLAAHVEEEYGGDASGSGWRPATRPSSAAGSPRCRASAR